jgi:NADH dehydrogenase
MAIIGKNKAVVDIPSPKLHFNGFLLGLYGCLSTLFH